MLTATYTNNWTVELAELLESDEVYFRLASEVRPLGFGELAFVPGLTGLAAGCVVQHVRFQGSLRDADRWVAEIEDQVVQTGARLCRVYLHTTGGPLPAALEKRGYQARRELAYAAPPTQLGIESKVRFLPVTSSDGWDERRRLHEEAPDNSDGYTVDPAEWCELIRRKCETGRKESFLIEYEGHVCGSIGAIRMANVLRLKNILITPTFRRLGLGLEAVRELAALTHRRGLSALTVFGIEGEAGSKLYERAGFSVVGYQTEWSKPLVRP